VHITRQDRGTGVRQPTVSKNTSLGREFHRSATWEEDGTTISVDVIAFVTGIRVQKYPDGSRDLLSEVTRFDVLGKDQFIQYVERAVFLWDRTRPGPDGTPVHDKTIDKTDEIGLFYPASLEEAEAQCRIFMENLDFEINFDPAAWV
jgi:hypothetical protein